MSNPALTSLPTRLFDASSSLTKHLYVMSLAWAVLGRCLGACMRVCVCARRRKQHAPPRLTAATAWAARVVAHPPLRRYIQLNGALTSLPAGLFASGFSVGGHLYVGGGACGRMDGGAWDE